MEQVKEGYLIDCISGQTLKATPEEVQAVQPFAKKLMEDYGYPVAHIQTRPQWHVKVRPSDVKKEYFRITAEGYLLFSNLPNIFFE